MSAWERKGSAHEHFDRIAARYPPRFLDIVLLEQRHYLQRSQRLPGSEVTHPPSIADLGCGLHAAWPGVRHLAGTLRPSRSARARYNPRAWVLSQHHKSLILFGAFTRLHRPPGFVGTCTGDPVLPVRWMAGWPDAVAGPAQRSSARRLVVIG